MASLPALSDHMAPDCVARFLRAAESRFKAGEFLRTERPLEAVYFYGYTVEMVVVAAYFRNTGFRPTDEITVETRNRRIEQAKQLKFMTGRPHQINGWTKFHEWTRSAAGDLSDQDRQRLRTAVNRAEEVYRHWRPSLRYQNLNVSSKHVGVVRDAAQWFLNEKERL